MTETIKTTQHFYTKDFNNYSNSENNFVANQELTVTITLNEYRKLIESDTKAQQKISEANNDRYTREDENRKLKLEITDLKERLYNSSVTETVITTNIQNGDVE